MKVGVIGLGGMGKHLAVNIVEAGFEVTVNDLREQPVQELVQYGARAAAQRAGSRCRFRCRGRVACLQPRRARRSPSAPTARSPAPRSGDIYIDTSTISPKVIREIAARAAERGVAVLDAPVSGGIAQREEGSLSIMVGGDAETLARARPVLEAFGSRIFHTGPIGAGATVKLINNLTQTSNQLAAMEALVLGVKAGLSVDVLREVIPASSGASRAFDSLVEDVMTTSSVPPAGNRPQRGLHTLVKDTALASELARDLSVPLLAGSLATQAYLACDARGWANREYWAVMEIFEELAGIRVRIGGPGVPARVGTGSAASGLRKSGGGDDTGWSGSTIS